MRFSQHQLSPGEIDHELVWLSVSLGSLAFAAVWFAMHLPWPHCFFLTITGHPCLTCGATRAAFAFFHLDFWSAWKWNPLVFIILCSISIFDAYAFAVLIGRLPRLRLTRLDPREKIVVRIAIVLLLLANWIYLLSRPRGIF